MGNSSKYHWMTISTLRINAPLSSLPGILTWGLLWSAWGDGWRWDGDWFQLAAVGVVAWASGQLLQSLTTLPPLLAALLTGILARHFHILDMRHFTHIDAFLRYVYEGSMRTLSWWTTLNDKNYTVNKVCYPWNSILQSTFHTVTPIRIDSLTMFFVISKCSLALVYMSRIVLQKFRMEYGSLPTHLPAFRHFQILLKVVFRWDATIYCHVRVIYIFK